MNQTEQLYHYHMGNFGVMSFIATQEDGDKIAAEVNRRRENKGQTTLTPIYKQEVAIAKFETFFNEL